ncbi:trypsin-like peptidase domain-containing protein [Rhizobium leguminosarum]|uniref:S1 family peptidase n=1 Tax=Rhizobium leguminosarum TaxID=384 RepID=UPI001C953E53|nr:serine protease [Rhizobium leguminosarum]MBY5706973.1 trypsin-like peptidase domain-containing protein [Rhizobium leguminosarum]
MSLLFKVIYTVLLFGITAVTVRELWFVWFDNRVYIGRFDVITETGKDDTASETFAKRIVAQQTIAAQQLADYRTRRDALSDTTYGIDGITPLRLPPEVLGGIDITVQEINVRQVLTAIRRSFLTPNEISGAVTQNAESVIALVDWPGAPSINGDNAAISKFLTPPRKNMQATAAHIACSIAWARASSEERRPFSWAKSLAAGLRAGVASNNTGQPSAVATTTKTNLAALAPRLQFCDFLAALADLYAFETKASSAEGLDDSQTSEVRRHVAVLRSHYADTTVLPDIYRLRADLLDLLPEGKRQPGELVDAQEDRLRYAMLNPKLRSLPEEEGRMAALAMARPALVLQDAKVEDLPANWSNLLARRWAEINAISAATGKIVAPDGQHVATGFIAAPGLMITAGHVVDQIRQPAPGTPAADTAKLCLGSDVDTCKESFPIGQVVYDGRADKSNVALLELSNHDPALISPAPISDTAIEPNAVVGRYAYVIGYPAIDARMPEEFIKHLLAGKSGIKRIMPGRILAFGNRSIFTSDISTAGGTSGAPFVDLLTGKVIGMSYAGRWQGERGKFAYSESIPRAALDIIGKRLRGEP